MHALVQHDPRGRLFILGAMLGLMLLEYAVARLAHRDAYDWRETAASFAVAAGQGLARVGEALIAVVPATFLYDHRLLHFPQATPVALVALLLATEFAYYWQHRAAHRIRWMWVTHAVHHSATRLNLSAAIRLGWTGAISGNWLFLLPLVWIGFYPAAVAGMMGLNLTYQLLIHTELIPSLGPLEWILNTPARHRVHHASNAACLDRNYGGILIVFDVLFGTLAAKPKDEPLRYGLAGRTPTLNPVRIALGEWAILLKDVAHARSWRGAVRLVLGAP